MLEIAAITIWFCFNEFWWLMFVNVTIGYHCWSLFIIVWCCLYSSCLSLSELECLSTVAKPRQVILTPFFHQQHCSPQKQHRMLMQGCYAPKTTGPSNITLSILPTACQIPMIIPLSQLDPKKLFCCCEHLFLLWLSKLSKCPWNPHYG